MMRILKTFALSARFTGNWRQVRLESESGFSLIELSLAILIYALGMAIAGVGFGRWIESSHLVNTRDTLLWHFRWAQAKAYEVDDFTSVNLDKYSPTYELYQEWNELGHYAFDSGVNYKDDYLQMPTGRIFYGVAGDSHAGGTIRLVDEHGDERDIVLYLTSGLAVKGEDTHDAS